MRPLVNLFSYAYRLIIDSLFPLSCEENEIVALSPEQALKALPLAPKCPFADMHAVFHYKDVRVSRCVWNIKYKKDARSVRIAGFALWDMLKRIMNEELRIKENAKSNTNTTNKRPTYLIVPIPITLRRRKERGYNQCELILDEIERLYRLEYADAYDLPLPHVDQTFTPISVANVPQLIFEKNLLIRTQHKSHHKFKNREERLHDAQGIFGLNEKTLLKYKEMFGLDTLDTIQVIIIDDVITTGSTMNEALKTLREGGFLNATGVSVAH